MFYLQFCQELQILDEGLRGSATVGSYRVRKTAMGHFLGENEMPVSEFNEQSNQQGIRGMEIKQRVRHRLQAEGLSIEGYRQLLNGEPIGSPEDREVILKLVVAPLTVEAAAQYDAEKSAVAGQALSPPEASAST